MNVFRVNRIGLAAAALAALALAPLTPACAGEPAGGANITGQTVYLVPGARLRYGESLTSRVYARIKSATLELQGNGTCTAFNCPVIHNKVPVFARRARLSDVRPTGPVVTERTLRIGDDGEDVRIMQELLNKKGFALTVDGKFGSGMQDAVSQFQQKFGIPADGEIGSLTREKLRA